MKLNQSQIALLKDATKVIVISVIIIIPIRLFLVQSFFVVGKSMEPSYSDGDYLLVDQISYDFSDPRRGDVVVFNPPNNPSQTYIKRVIGLPYDTILLDGVGVRVMSSNSDNGVVLKEEYIQGDTSTCMEDNTRVISLGEGEYFVLGDNRIDSWDSRCWGSLGKDDILGKVWFRLWPVGSINSF